MGIEYFLVIPAIFMIGPVTGLITSAYAAGRQYYTGRNDVQAYREFSEEFRLGVVKCIDKALAVKDYLKDLCKIRNIEHQFIDASTQTFNYDFILENTIELMGDNYLLNDPHSN